jgi:mannose-6-phosphate isomerase-like protein (cupin superfamily)
MKSAVNIDSKFRKIPGYWSPKIIAQMNDYHIKLARVKGEFTRHRHADTDETFIVFKGELTIEIGDRRVRLREGDLFVVPKGVEHRPIAQEECYIMLIEPAGTINTGNSGGELTAPDGEWI